MATITIVITDLPKGKGCSVLTDAGAPAVGQPRTPAQELAAGLLRTCQLQASCISFGAAPATLAGELAIARKAA